MPKAGKQPVTTIAMSIKSILDRFSVSIPKIKFVYDDQLSYETAIASFRKDSKIKSDTKPFPLLAIRRGVLRHTTEGISRRSVTQLSVLKDQNSALLYKSIYAEFDLEFLFIHNQTYETEAFEINYLSEIGISSQAEISMELPEIGAWKNFCHFSPLDSKVFNNTDSFYQAISGSIIVKGIFLTLDERYGRQGLIKEIHAYINDLNNNDLEYASITIT